MNDRFDLYAPVHKGLRNAMLNAVVRLGKMDPADAADVGDALVEPRDLLVWCELRLAVEERHVHAAIAARRPSSVVDGIHHDYEGHERAIAALRAQADAFQRAPERRGAHQLYLAVTRFVGDNFVHMAAEEAEMNALLYSLFSDEELRAIHAAILSGEAREAIGRTVRWMIPAQTPAERDALIAGARPNLYPALFDQLMATIRQLLAPRDWAKLAGALDLARAA